MIIPRLFTYFTLALTCISLNAHADLAVTNAYIQVVPQGYENAAAFLSIKNNDRHPVHLTYASSSNSNTAELQQYKENDGVMMLQTVESIAIAGNSTLKMQPDSEQITLVDLRDTLKVGDKIKLSLRFSNGKKLKTVALVVAP